MAPPATFAVDDERGIGGGRGNPSKQSNPADNEKCRRLRDTLYPFSGHRRLGGRGNSGVIQPTHSASCLLCRLSATRHCVYAVSLATERRQTLGGRPCALNAARPPRLGDPDRRTAVRRRLVPPASVQTQHRQTAPSPRQSVNPRLAGWPTATEIESYQNTDFAQ